MKIVGCSKSTISYHCRKNGIQIKTNRKIDDETNKKIIELRKTQ